MLGFILISGLTTAQDFQTDRFETTEGPLTITFVKHASLLFKFDNKTIHVDPVRRMGDYSKLPKADIILITHHHGDHFDLNAIDMLKKEGTKIIATQQCVTISEELENVTVMSDNESKTLMNMNIRSIPAYNIKHKRDNGEPYHPKGKGNGYVVTFGDKNIYIAGDTENIPEMKKLENIDIAFLPMNVPYTMTPEMVADAAKTFKPEVLYPYHYGKTDTSELTELLKDEEIDVRIRDM
jgi:L-ascorbate metabolism protein UlaG (beta-lactamase superfamily)